MPRVHYDATALAPSQAKETTFVSEWFLQRPELPVRHVGSRAAVMASGGVMPAFTGHEVNNVAEWYQQRPELPVRHVQSVTPSGAPMPTFTGKEQTFPDKWFKQQPEPIVQVKTAFPSGGIMPPFTGAEQINPDKWIGYQPETFRHVVTCARLPSGGVWPAFSGKEVVFPDKWFHQEPDPANVIAVESVVPSGAVQSSYTGAEIVFVDKWFKQQPEPIRLVVSTATNPSGGIIPAYRGPEITFVSEWMGSRPDGALREVRRIIDLTQSVEPIAGALEQSATSIDRWFVLPAPIRSLFAVVQPQTVAAPVTVSVSAPVAPSVSGWAFAANIAGNVAQARPLNAVSFVAPIRATAEAVTADRFVFCGPTQGLKVVSGAQRSSSVAPVYVLTAFDWLPDVMGPMTVQVRSVMGPSLAAPIVVPAAGDWNVFRAPIFPTAAISRAVFAAGSAGAAGVGALPLGWNQNVGRAIAVRVLSVSGGQREFFVYPIVGRTIDLGPFVPLTDPDGGWYGLQLLS